MRRIDAFGLANCGVVNNRDDPAWCCSSPPTVAEKGGRRVVDESGEEGRGSVGKRVECSLNKQIPKRTHYLRLHRVAGYAADAWRTASVGYISGCGINGGDFRSEPAPPSNSRRCAMNNENFYAGRPGLPRREFFPDIAGLSSAVKFARRACFSAPLYLYSSPPLAPARGTCTRPILNRWWIPGDGGEGKRVFVKSGPSICFNNSVKEDYFLGLLLRAIKQGDGNPSLENGNNSR